MGASLPKAFPPVVLVTKEEEESYGVECRPSVSKSSSPKEKGQG
ncbi:uncharacterized protein G2W53_033919 [Senna tora]|uniref:Uncharacterized protein n=1 Tax=Senna tora TaxID=362788 RepID=A0A834W8Y5_9FABA|nr:uncharacterized protein G2W53_033919 [Senna tora]